MHVNKHGQWSETKSYRLGPCPLPLSRISVLLGQIFNGKRIYPLRSIELQNPHHRGEQPRVVARLAGSLRQTLAGQDEPAALLVGHVVARVEVDLTGVHTLVDPLVADQDPEVEAVDHGPDPAVRSGHLDRAVEPDEVVVADEALTGLGEQAVGLRVDEVRVSSGAGRHDRPDVVAVELVAEVHDDVPKRLHGRSHRAVRELRTDAGHGAQRSRGSVHQDRRLCVCYRNAEGNRVRTRRSSQSHTDRVGVGVVARVAEVGVQADERLRVAETPRNGNTGRTKLGGDASVAVVEHRSGGVLAAEVDPLTGTRQHAVELTPRTLHRLVEATEKVRLTFETRVHEGPSRDALCSAVLNADAN